MGKEHAAPTARTIKELYGTASRCAYPDCRQPLYLNERGKRILNSQVCHIQARSEGGRRWNPQQTEDENRSYDNLLILCHAHHGAVDDPASVEEFSVDTLRSWKLRQIETKDDGYDLTENEVAEVARVSFPQQIINLQADIIHVGGEGGRLGGGGGGGGAIGQGARGGPGGSGGTRFNLSGKNATGYGGGGGGAGSLDLSRYEWPQAVDQKPSAPPRPPPRRSRDVPGEVRGLRLTTLFLADNVRFYSGLLCVLGGGWEYTMVSAFPVEIGGTLVCGFQFNGVEPNLTIKLNVTVRDPDGACVLEEEFAIDSGEIRPVMSRHSAMPLRFKATQAGVWTIAIAEGPQELGWVPLEIRQGAT